LKRIENNSQYGKLEMTDDNISVETIVYTL